MATLKADMVVVHPRIYTCALTCEEIAEGKRDFPVIEDGGVAVLNGKIVYVGNAADVEDMIGPDTEVIDGTGQIMTPGFIETHCHPIMFGATIVEEVDLLGVTTQKQCLDMLRERAENTPDGHWVKSSGWNQLIWTDTQEIPTKKELDEVSPNNPLFAYDASHHIAIANSLAMQLAGVTKDTPVPPGASIDKGEDGEPNGIFREFSVIGLILAAIPPYTQDDLANHVKAAGEYVNPMGITSMLDAMCKKQEINGYQLAKETGRLTYRANLMYYLDTADGGVEYNKKKAEDTYCYTGFGDDMLKFNGIKIFVDGLAASKTAAMRDPYFFDPTSNGTSVWSPEELKELIVASHKNGWQVGLHCMGDRGADMAIEAFRAANEISDTKPFHHYLIHCAYFQYDQIPAFKELGLGCSVEPGIVSLLGESQIMSDFQKQMTQPAGLLIKNGIMVGGGSDCPVISPAVIPGIYYAVTRKDCVSDGVAGTGVYGTESCVTPTEALLMWTKMAAWFFHDEDKLGSVEVGNLADLVLLDQDFITCDTEDIMKTNVTKTILGGKVVYSA